MESTIDLFSRMIWAGEDRDLPEMKIIQDKIALFEALTGKSVREHLGFGDIGNIEIRGY